MLASLPKLEVVDNSYELPVPDYELPAPDYKTIEDIQDPVPDYDILTRLELYAMKMVQLKEIAKDMNITRISKLRKAQLIERIFTSQSSHCSIENDENVIDFFSKTMKELKSIAKEMGLKRFSKLRKAALIGVICANL